MSTKQYIGTKLIQAEPAVRYNGNVYGIGDTMPVLAVVNGVAEQGYRVIDPDGYVSWSPREVFEEAYRETMGMNFGLAVEAMKRGMRIARWDWDGKDQTYVFLAENEGFHTDADISEMQDLEEGIPASEFLVLFTAQETLLLGWQPSVEDILADDWYIVDKLDSEGKRTTLPI